MENTEYSIIDVVYPVGSIYMSVNTTDPSTLFPNTTWGKIEGRFLLGSSSMYTSGDTGGSKDAVVVSHTHEQNPHKHGFDSLGRYAATASARAGVGDTLGDDGYSTSSVTATNKSTGVSGTNKNMPPYLVVNIWKRTA